MDLNPTASYFMLLGGLLVACLEFLRPGWVVPGVAGSVAAVWGLSRLMAAGLNLAACAIFFAGLSLITMHAWYWRNPASRLTFFRREHWAGALGVAFLAWASAHLVEGPVRIDALSAQLGTVAFSLITAPLLAVAFRARRNKATA